MVRGVVVSGVVERGVVERGVVERWTGGGGAGVRFTGCGAGPVEARC